MTALLSILIPTVIGREAKLRSLLLTLQPQVSARDDVELLILPDDRQMTIGDKRNRLIDLSSGDYVAFVDDDDAVATDYVDLICGVLLRDRPDVLCFLVTVKGHGPDKICRYHPSLQHRDLKNEYHRKPNHLMVWRRALAANVRFPSLRFGEDTAWAERMCASAQKVATVERALYTYQYDPRDNSNIRNKR